MKAIRFDYERTCSRCGGTGDDPEIENCVCDCCGGEGVELLNLTEAEAMNYPGATRVTPKEGVPK